MGTSTERSFRIGYWDQEHKGASLRLAPGQRRSAAVPGVECRGAIQPRKCPVLPCPHAHERGCCVLAINLSMAQCPVGKDMASRFFPRTAGTWAGSGKRMDVKQSFWGLAELSVSTLSHGHKGVRGYPAVRGLLEAVRIKGRSGVNHTLLFGHSMEWRWSGFETVKWSVWKFHNSKYWLWNLSDRTNRMSHPSFTKPFTRGKDDLNKAKCPQEHQATSPAREFMNTLGTIEPWVTVAHLYLQLSQSSIWGKGYHWRKMGGEGQVGWGHLERERVRVVSGGLTCRLPAGPRK